ncbi:restriction endonuclease subunit S [Olleya sp. HaHaR_3_96]|uniref:restriction endonuclease subunit S n=1 Tax=Olleya sp. HaHaR_3_96 TaxID=2745560 RepID=UPI001C4EF397|nr:restriction endonuclease subunit S [Olleya sp. HaHaR_3_96]QXP58366.1 restriction endonuclease subunit S [Olleya sp. HaHaR_3_96]
MSSVDDKLPDGWNITTLGEVCDNVSRRFDFEKKSNVVFVNTGDVLDGKFLHSDYVSKSGLPGQAKKAIKKGDILFSEIRPKNKRFARVDFDAEDYVVSTKFMVIEHNELIDLNFLFTLLTSDKQVNEFNQIAESRSGTFPQITFDAISYLTITLPPIIEQKVITKVVNTFNDKIENLCAQNSTLEQTAQTIFKEWFGKYQIDDVMPDGWRVGKLGEEFDISIGRTPPRKESEWFSNTPTGKKWISIKDIGNCGIYIDNTSEYLTDKAIDKFNIPVIPENTTILSFKMTVGKLTITTEEMLSNEAIAHLKLKEGSYLTSEYIYLYLQNLDFNALGSTSSIVTAINSTMIKNLDFVIPSEEVLIEFQLLIDSFFKKIKNNTQQIQSLTKTRDVLLPKLMRGEIRVNGFKK